MKTTIIYSALISLLFALPIAAQDRTTVNASSSEISDNLDLRAIASIFGGAKNLEDFERQLNDPKIQISNLDLNDDNQVDYLRVIESVEGNTHLIIVQSVLGRDNYQDVATIEVDKDRNNQVQVQVVGDVYMYGQNYIYEPVYVATPIIYNTFWIPTYQPYCSMWYWNYYPTFYYAWNPCPVFRYRNNISLFINFNHHYNYVNTRSCHRAVALHEGRRANYCERISPNRGFAYRNNSVKNRYELDQTRTVKNLSTRNDLAYTSRNNNQKSQFGVRESKTTKYNSNSIITDPTRNPTTIRNTDRESTNSFAGPRNSVTKEVTRGEKTRVRQESSQVTTNPIRNAVTNKQYASVRQESLSGGTNPIRNTVRSRANESIRQDASNGNRNPRSNSEYTTNKSSETRSENSYQNSPSKQNSRISNTQNKSSQSRDESNSKIKNTPRQNYATTARRA